MVQRYHHFPKFQTHMGFIEDELSEVRRLCEHVIPGCRLVSCVKTMVRTEIRRTDYKAMVACIQFPANYPNDPLLIELKSKTLSQKLLQRLTDVSEEEAKNHLRKPQVLKVLSFLRKFIDENPLSCCYDEISALRASLCAATDELKLRQKASALMFRIVNEKFYLIAKVVIPDNYPSGVADLCEVDSNFPPALHYHMVSQAKEIARQCVEPPLRRRPNDGPFKPKPSLQKAVAFLIDCVKRLPKENCQFCKESCFPSDPSLIVVDENSPRHIERVYCGHLYHQQCLYSYMRSPPFGDKKCPTCGVKVCHRKWSLSDKLAEDRWAHEQARERELAEVEEFFQ